MISYSLNTIDDAEKLVDICKRYKKEYQMDTDVCFAQYTVNGCSLLGVTSLLGHFVTLQPVGDFDSIIYNKFANEIMGVN